MGSPKSTPAAQIAVDPNLAAEQAAAQKTLIDNLQVQAQGDTAQMMARYGTRLALSGSGMAPDATAAAPVAPATSSTSWFTPLLNPILQDAGKA